MGDDDEIQGKPTLYLDGKELRWGKTEVLKVKAKSGDEWYRDYSLTKEASISVNVKVKKSDVINFFWGLCKEEALYEGNKLAQWIRYHPFDARLPRKIKKARKKMAAKRIAENYAILDNKHILKYIKGKRQ